MTGTGSRHRSVDVGGAPRGDPALRGDVCIRRSCPIGWATRPLAVTIDIYSHVAPSLDVTAAELVAANVFETAA